MIKVIISLLNFLGIWYHPCATFSLFPMVWQHRDYRTITALSLGLRPCESGQLSTIIPQNHGITITYMAMSDRTYVSNTHAHVRMSVWVFSDRNSNAKKRKTSSLNSRSSGISNVPSSYVNVRQCACVRADCSKKYMAAQQLLNSFFSFLYCF